MTFSFGPNLSMLEYQIKQYYCKWIKLYGQGRRWRQPDTCVTNAYTTDHSQTIRSGSTLFATHPAVSDTYSGSKNGLFQIFRTSMVSAKQIAADDILMLLFFFCFFSVFFLFFFLREKDISCESTAWTMIHMKWQVLFTLKNKSECRPRQLWLTL